MPEAAVNEDHGSETRKDEVRLSRKLPVEPIAEAHPVKRAPQRNLGKGILSPDTGHHAASGFRIYHISHERRATSGVRFPSSSGARVRDALRLHRQHLPPPHSRIACRPAYLIREF